MSVFFGHSPKNTLTKNAREASQESEKTNHSQALRTLVSSGVKKGVVNQYWAAMIIMTARETETIMPKYNHDEHYRDLLLRQVPSDCRNTLDVGCGDGGFARRLSDRSSLAVTGIDRDQTMIERARAETGNRSIQFIEADFMRYSFEKQFDFISATASLHHMPFEQALEKMVSLLRPGGVLAVLGLFREVSLADRGVALVAVPVNTFYALSRGWSSSGAPIKRANMSLQEIRKTVSSHLPDAYLRRLLLWRYLLTWQKPQE